MSLCPFLGPASVFARAPKVKDHDQNDKRQYQAFLDEVLGRCALPHPVPFRIGDSTRRGRRRLADDGGRRRLRGLDEIREFYIAALVLDNHLLSIARTQLDFWLQVRGKNTG